MSNMFKKLGYLAPFVIIVISCLIAPITSTTHGVFIYKLISGTLGQFVTSSTLVWENYSNDPNQLEYAVQGGKVITSDEHYPIYICRATAEGIYISGHTEKKRQKYVCVVSLSMSIIRTYSTFDILLNKGHLAKLTWKPWSTFTPGIPKGAVSVSANHGETLYVARYSAHHNRPNSHENSENILQGADYYLGKFDPQGRGKIVVTEGDKGVEYKDGEILVETEPTGYELHDIVIDKDNTKISVNDTQLGFAILSNKGDDTNLVETVMSYEYNKIQYWGTHEGIARGLPTLIFEHGLRHPENISWGLQKVERQIKTKAVNTTLRPGTALNVTLTGKYTSMEAPYTATLIAFYDNDEESVSRKISQVVQKSDLHDIKFDFSPVYWIENGTVMPTSTTTTSTTTERTTTSTDEPKPIYSPPADNNRGEDTSSSAAGSGDNNNSKKHIDDMESSSEIAADESRESHPAGEVAKIENTKTSKQAEASALSIAPTLLVTMGCTIFTFLRPSKSVTLLY